MDMTAVEVTRVSRPPAATLAHKAARAIQAGKLAAQREARAVSDDALSQAVRAKLSPEVKLPLSAQVQLNFDADSGRVVGRIVDRATGELIKQIPSDEMLQLIAATKELIGQLLDEHV